MIYFRGHMWTEHDASCSGEVVKTDKDTVDGMPAAWPPGEDSFTMTCDKPFGTPEPWKMPAHFPNDGFSGTVECSYTLGDSKIVDINHAIHSYPVVSCRFEQRWAIVAGRGSDALGEWVSLGALVYPSEYCPGVFLFSARRHITLDDPRVSMSAKAICMEAESDFMDCCWPNICYASEYEGGKGLDPGAGLPHPEPEAFYRLLACRLLPDKPFGYVAKKPEPKPEPKKTQMAPPTAAEPLVSAEYYY